MFCRQCGSEIPDGARFCVKCGAPASADGEATPELERQMISEPNPAPVGAPRRFVRLGAVLAVIAAVVVVGAGVFLALGSLSDDTVTVAFASEDPVRVTSAARIVPLSSEGTPLEYYLVRIKSATDAQGDDIDLSEFDELEVSGSGGFSMQDLIPDGAEGTYVLEIDDGETTHTTPPIVIDEVEGLTGGVEMEPGSDDDEGDADEDDPVVEDEVDDNEISDDEALELYREVLDLFYDNITTGWANYEFTYEFGDMPDINTVFPDSLGAYTLDTIGYQLEDLDGDGVPELLIGVSGSGTYNDDNLVFDLYTVKGGEVVHLASSTLLERYQLCEGGTIYYSRIGGVDGAKDYIHYEIVDNTTSIIECVWSVPDADDSDDGVRWYYSTTELGYDGSAIGEEEATEIIDSWPQVVELTLTPFSRYVSDAAGEDESADSAGVVDLTAYLDSFDDFRSVVGGAESTEAGAHESWIVGNGIQYGNYAESTSVDEVNIDDGQYELFGISIGFSKEAAVDLLNGQGWIEAGNGTDFVKHENGDMRLSLRIKSGTVSSIAFYRSTLS